MLAKDLPVINDIGITQYSDRVYFTQITSSKLYPPPIFHLFVFFAIALKSVGAKHARALARRAF